MDTQATLLLRSASKCELCGAHDELAVYEVPPNSDGSADQCVLICPNCRDQIEASDTMDTNHWLRTIPGISRAVSTVSKS